jgi:hypothetical protein
MQWLQQLFPKGTILHAFNMRARPIRIEQAWLSDKATRKSALLQGTT